ARAAGALGAAPGGARAPDGRAAAGLSASPRAPGPPRGAARGRCRRWRAGAAADRARGPRRQGRPGAKLLAAMSGGHLSKEFFELVKAIGESRSKQEEDKIIVNEIAVLKQHLSQPAIPPKKMKEYMIRAVYAEMLGHDAGFAYIHAVKLTHEKNLLAKR
ncbi:unnamed protein product, partial [Prorocentrum cordatum]